MREGRKIGVNVVFAGVKPTWRCFSLNRVSKRLEQLLEVVCSFNHEYHLIDHFLAANFYERNIAGRGTEPTATWPRDQRSYVTKIVIWPFH